jgi:hypothetical protein
VLFIREDGTFGIEDMAAVDFVEAKDEASALKRWEFENAEAREENAKAFQQFTEEMK